MAVVAAIAALAVAGVVLAGGYGGLAVVLAAADAALLTAVVLRYLRARAILDRPNARSSHGVATPRGGGLGVVPVVVAGWAIIALVVPATLDLAAVLAGATLLALVSWFDDVRTLAAAPRFAVQLAVVAVGTALLPGDALVFQGLLPLVADRLLTALAWLWFVNLFNFMDGIDGITGSELASIGGGLALAVSLAAPAGLAAGADPALPFYALVLAAAGLGFLVWNWHPAQVFLGDVGSVPLGYLTGWLLITAAAMGLWPAAVILPLYYLTDATATLLRRLAKGEPIFQAHRQHAYQRAVQRGLSHSQVVWRIVAGNLALIACAAAATAIGAWALLPAGLVVLVLIGHLTTAARPPAA
ncbi:MAG: glycosyltransferase family 4 protein [Rhodospirillaceae bacterium]|nr:glycosyltransferase family 4 protein [Rhodospirillaceae bacterium]